MDSVVTERDFFYNGIGFLKDSFCFIDDDVVMFKFNLIFFGM